MSHIEVSNEYVVVIPVSEDGGPDEHRINLALGRPECALDYDVSPLDHQRVTVFVRGLLTDGGEPAALVGCGDGAIRVVPVAWLAPEYPDRPDPLVLHRFGYWPGPGTSSPDVPGAFSHRSVKSS